MIEIKIGTGRHSRTAHVDPAEIAALIEGAGYHPKTKVILRSGESFETTTSTGSIRKLVDQFNAGRE